MEKNRYNVQIGINNYLLKTSKSKEETEKIVKYVDEMINQAKETLHYRNPTMHATLACINIADELNTKANELEKLKEISAVPIREYEPLKAEFKRYKEDNAEAEQKMKALIEKVEKLENELRLTILDRDRFKLELDRQVKDSERNKIEINDLRNKLLEQEKQTLIAKRQLQEAIKN